MKPGSYKRTPEIIAKWKASRLAGKGFSHTDETKARISEAGKGKRLGSANPRWNGGISKTADGYILVRMPEHPNAMANGYVMQHRLVMERHIGRILHSGEHVHHVNGDRSDNRIENLELMTPAEHTREHHIGAKRSGATKQRLSKKAKSRWAATKQRVECAECKSVFDRRGRGATYCSRSCANAARKRRGWHPEGTGAKISAARRKLHDR